MVDLQQFEDQGYVIGRALFSLDEIEGIRESFMQLAGEGPVPGLSDILPDADTADPLSRYPRVMMPHRREDLEAGRLSKRYLLDPRIGDVLRDVMHDEPVAVQSMFYFKPAGARGQDFHQDNFYLRVKPGTCYAAWVAVDASNEENGGMMVVPGSNKLELLCPEEADSKKFFTTEHLDVPDGMSAVTMRLQPGDVLFFNGSVIHGSHPNSSTDRMRRAFICHYIPRATAQVSHWYNPCLGFDGEELRMQENPDGGPCGTIIKGRH
jgi:ectoine hydroxylase-related dioxygenase (phytanoyl-CoA dioxygenase family)